MKLCIFGAGTIGSYLGALLTAAGGADVTLIGRGARLRALQREGVRLTGADARRAIRVQAVADPAALGIQDYVFLTTKAYDAPAAAAALHPLLGADTAVVTAMNGVPWWYFQGLAGPYRDHALASVDPDGRLAHFLPARRVLGAAVWAAVDMPAPGVVHIIAPLRLPFGELDGTPSPRAQRLAAALAAAGIEAPLSDDIRTELWFKLWGNLSFNPISVLTHASLLDIARDPGGRAVARAMMAESEHVAAAVGVRMPVTIDERMAMAERVGRHPTSSLQDALTGKPIELEALLGAVQEMARLVGVATPTLDLVHDLTRLRARAPATG